MDNKLKIDDKILEKFDNWAWVTSSDDYKKQALQDLEDFCAKAEHRDRIKLNFMKMDNPNQLGEYDTKTNMINVNENLLANTWKRKYVAIDTIIHEGRHAYQRAAISNPSLEKDQINVTKWRENQPPSYVNGDVPTNPYYRFQAIERDAFDFAEDAIAKNFTNRKGEETFSSTYLSDADSKFKKPVEQLALTDNALGPDYKNKIDDLVHAEYQRIHPIGQNVTVKHMGEEYIVEHPTKIGDLRKTLNGQMDEINKQLKELNQERRQVEGAPLTKEQAEKLAASNHLNGADKELDKKVQELQDKRDKLSQHKEDIIKYGKENGLDTTLWRHAPEIFKGEGLKYYESSMAAIEHNHKFYNGQETVLQTSRDQLEARLQTPEAKSEIAKNSEEILVQDKERLAKLEGLDQKINELTNEKHDIMRLRDIIPSRKLDNEIDVQGDSKNVHNLLSQADQLKQQATELQQAQAQSCGQSM